MADRDDPKPSPHSLDEAEHQQPIAASTLFRGRRQVLIEHEGETYRLILTRNNKLLLQK